MSLFYQAFRKGTPKEAFEPSDIWEVNVDLAGLHLTTGFMDGSHNSDLQYDNGESLISAYTQEVHQKLQAGFVYVNSAPHQLDEIINFDKLQASKLKKISFLSLKELYALYASIPADLIQFIGNGTHINMHKKKAIKLCNSFSVPVHFFSPRLAKHLKNKEVKVVLKDTDTDPSQLIPFLEAKTTSSYPWDYEAQVYIRPTNNGGYEFVILDTDGKYFTTMGATSIEEFMAIHFAE
ncbi:hypothetical protein [Paraflavitalea sp. CAU 1676]|uniref:hypothetical protein n=1 Tax=Paraflavitalea sp. CAU 1676 TaxID=3032598 RepID=UPI0023DBC39D|nr:hypothetical protein [Paraflavitalea sp. CAU 1676]MDF2188981.1 hypothetical protein [Paraflavitalea sp. CAU 1676]